MSHSSLHTAALPLHLSVFSFYPSLLLSLPLSLDLILFISLFFSPSIYFSLYIHISPSLLLFSSPSVFLSLDIFYSLILLSFCIPLFKNIFSLFSLVSYTSFSFSVSLFFSSFLVIIIERCVINLLCPSTHTSHLSKQGYRVETTP